LGVKKISENVDKDKLKQYIIEKYGKQKEFAELLGLSEDRLSKKLKTLSNGFIKQISEHIPIPYVDGTYFKNNRAGRDIVGRDRIVDTGQIAKFKTDIKILTAKLAEQNKLLGEKERYIKLLEKQLGI
jgi:hypothetical protein